MITYHFPPSTVAASFRPLRLAKYLPRLGYEVWVLAATMSSFPRGRTDPKLCDEVPPSVHVTRVPNLNPLLWYESHCRSVCARPVGADGSVDTKARARRVGIKSLLAELAKFPDMDAPWATASLLPALRIVRRNHIDMIYTSAPPFGAHLLGLALKRLTGRPWIAHYGNPWTANPSISWKHARLKKGCDRLDSKIVHSADAILVLDEILAECIRDMGRSDGVFVHPNGFDPEHFENVDVPKGKFTITYAGSLYNMHDPGVIYDALELVSRMDPAARADMRIVFAGPPESDPLRNGAPANIEFTGPLPHAGLAKALGESHLLLDFLTASSDKKFTVSCKLYEYMAAHRPILAVTPEGPMADEVRRLRLGRVAHCDDPAAIARAILQFYSEYKAGRLPIPNGSRINRYSAPNLAREFSDIVEEVCSTRAGRRPGAIGGVR